MHPTPAGAPPTLPLVVQLGFAGSRMLYGARRVDPVSAATFDTAMLEALLARLQELPQTLGLSPHHLLCGVSQLAIGADTLFAQALQRLGLPHRILLPQTVASFLGAGEPAEPDFTAAERAVATALLGGDQIVEVRVASDAEDRHARFEDANMEILRESDLVVCMIREGAQDSPGGTRDLLQRAARAGTPVLLLEVAMREGRPVLSPWRPLEGSPAFVAPGMPAELVGLSLPPPRARELPTAEDFLEAVRRFASANTRRHSGLFKRAAVAIIVLHIAATLLAALASKVQSSAGVALLLATELILLAAGLTTHQRLHRSAAARSWAVTRLLAEVLRSMKSACLAVVSLDYPRTLAFPRSFEPLLRTVAVLHAVTNRRTHTTDWAAQRASYLHERLVGDSGQLRYFDVASRAAARRHGLAQIGFWVFSGTAFIATAAKLASVAGLMSATPAALVSQWGGLLAITLPVAAVGFLSWSAAADLEARAATYAEMHGFLARQVARIEAATSARDFARAVRETELGILSENLSWFSRRLFKGVS